jgi:hypothetical protein
MVAGGQVFCHPSQQGRNYILDKLIDFHHQHGTPPDQTLTDLYRAIQQIPKTEYRNEAAPLQTRCKRAPKRRREPQPIGEILLAVLARLGVGTVESKEDRDAS